MSYICKNKNGRFWDAAKSRWVHTPCLATIFSTFPSLVRWDVPGGEWVPFDLDELNFAPIAAEGHPISTEDCPMGLKRGQICEIASDNVTFHGEGPLKLGMKVKFERYGWDYPITFGQKLRQVALFRFPDGSYRSLLASSVRPSGKIAEKN